jgi:hypothetical protein
MKSKLGLGASPMKDGADKSLLGNKRSILFDSEEDTASM